MSAAEDVDMVHRLELETGFSKILETIEQRFNEAVKESQKAKERFEALRSENKSELDAVQHQLRTSKKTLDVANAKVQELTSLYEAAKNAGIRLDSDLQQKNEALKNQIASATERTDAALKASFQKQAEWLQIQNAKIDTILENLASIVGKLKPPAIAGTKRPAEAPVEENLFV